MWNLFSSKRFKYLAPIFWYILTIYRLELGNVSCNGLAWQIWDKHHYWAGQTTKSNSKRSFQYWYLQSEIYKTSNKIQLYEIPLCNGYHYGVGFKGQPRRLKESELNLANVWLENIAKLFTGSFVSRRTNMNIERKDRINISIYFSA